MRVHHLNCATMCPLGGSLLSGPREGGAPYEMVCHCLLVETNAGLVLVDTGLGTDDVHSKRARLGLPFVLGMRPAFDPRETALACVEALGFSRADVRHVIVTHLDLDHAGGLPDFPDAEVHVYARELAAARARASLNEKMRYLPAQWAHGPRFRTYATSGERWKGFECVRPLDGLDGVDGSIALVPMIGHTRGHCAVAIDGPGGALVHAGDAYFHRGEMHPEAPTCPPALEAFQAHIARDRKARRDNRDRLRELARREAGAVTVFCAHDPVEFARLAAG